MRKIYESKRENQRLQASAAMDWFMCCLKYIFQTIQICHLRPEKIRYVSNQLSINNACLNHHAQRKFKWEC